MTLSVLLFLLQAIVFLNSSVHVPKEGLVYDLKPGMTTNQLIEDLVNKNVIHSPYIYGIYIDFQVRTHLRAGEYFFAKGATPIHIWRQVTTGTGLYQHRFLLVPGWNMAQLRSALARETSLRHQLDTLTDPEILAAIHEKSGNPEGLFYPDTYFYVKGNSDLSLLKRAYHLMEKKLQTAWDARTPGLPYATPYEALIAASLVEKEAFLPQEKPVIAGVLINRLRQNMALQFDPTVIYGIKDRYDGVIHKSDLQDVNPYNTYVIKGLPPTPIAMANLASIQAVLNPAEHDYLYFVARHDGSHQFSLTLNAHHHAVKDFSRHQAFFNRELLKKYLRIVLNQSFSK